MLVFASGRLLLVQEQKTVTEKSLFLEVPTRQTALAPAAPATRILGRGHK